MSAKTIKVLGAGSALLDLLVHVDDAFIVRHAGGEKGGMNMPPADVMQAMQRAAEQAGPVTKASGGSSANTLCGLSRLGMDTAFFGKIGKDANGEFYRNFYAALGGGVNSFKVSTDTPTGCCLCLITPDSQRTMRTNLGASGTLTEADVTDEDFEGVTHLHMEGYLLFNLPVFRKLLDTAKKHGCTISFDLSSFEVVRSFRDEIRSVLRDYTDLVFANEDEAREFSGTANPEESLKELLELCGTACVKVGKKGAFIGTRGQETIHTDAELVQAVDTTGAGDLWQTGFLYGWLRGKSNALSGRFGAAVAAEVVQVTGAQIAPDRWALLRAEFDKMEQETQETR